MLVVSLWSVNCRFWSHRGCLGWKVTIYCPFRYRLVLCITKFTKNVLPLITEKSSLEVSLSLSHTYISLHKGFNLNFLTSFRVTRSEHHARQSPQTLGPQRSEEFSLSFKIQNSVKNHLSIKNQSTIFIMITLLLRYISVTHTCSAQVRTEGQYCGTGSIAQPSSKRPE